MWDMEDEMRDKQVLCVGWDRNTDGQGNCLEDPSPTLPLSSSPQDLSRYTLMSFFALAEGDAPERVPCL